MEEAFSTPLAYAKDGEATTIQISAASKAAASKAADLQGVPRPLSFLMPKHGGRLTQGYVFCGDTVSVCEHEGWEALQHRVEKAEIAAKAAMQAVCVARKAAELAIATAEAHAEKAQNHLQKLRSESAVAKAEFERTAADDATGSPHAPVVSQNTLCQVARVRGKLNDASDLFLEADSWLFPSKAHGVSRSPMLAIWKPCGMTTTMDAEDQQGLKALVAAAATRLGCDLSRPQQPIGRLDKETSGLLLLTDNGDLNRILRIKNGITKTYFATVSKAEASSEQLDQLLRGVVIDAADPRPAVALSAEVVGCEISPHKLSQRNAQGDLPVSRYAQIRIRISEGRRHVVRRMLAAVGLPVRRLHREAIGCASLESLGLREPGSVALVEAGQVVELLAACGTGGLQPPPQATTSEAVLADAQSRGRAIYNAIRCGHLVCNLRRSGIQRADDAARLTSWLRENWDLEGPCFGPFRILCPGVTMPCRCEDPSYYL